MRVVLRGSKKLVDVDGGIHFVPAGRLATVVKNNNAALNFPINIYSSSDYRIIFDHIPDTYFSVPGRYIRIPYMTAPSNLSPVDLFPGQHLPQDIQEITNNWTLSKFGFEEGDTVEIHSSSRKPLNGARGKIIGISSGVAALNLIPPFPIDKGKMYETYSIGIRKLRKIVITKGHPITNVFK